MIYLLSLPPQKNQAPFFYYLSPKETLFRGIYFPPNIKSKKVGSVYIYSCYQRRSSFNEQFSLFKKLALYIYTHVISVGPPSMKCFGHLISKVRKLALYIYTHVISVGFLLFAPKYVILRRYILMLLASDVTVSVRILRIRSTPDFIYYKYGCSCLRLKVK